MRLILASRSPRRKEILKELVGTFEIIPAEGEESARGETVEETVVALARGKAEEVAALPVAAGAAVLGADTVVVLDGEILGKPKDEGQAFAMLSALSGRRHEVWTGVCLILPDGKARCAAEKTEVEFLPLTEEFIRGYIASGSPMDKAGAYGIQDGGLVGKIVGSYTNVVGLPAELCGRLLTESFAAEP